MYFFLLSLLSRHFFLLSLLSQYFFLLSSFLTLKWCKIGLALRMKTCCLSGEEQSKIVGMHKVGAKEVQIVTKLGH